MRVTGVQLVGHGSAESTAKLLGTRIDLLDAFDDERIDIEVVLQIMDVDAARFTFLQSLSATGPSRAVPSDSASAHSQRLLLVRLRRADHHRHSR